MHDPVEDSGARPILGATPGSTLRWLALVAAVTGVLWRLRDALDDAHMAMAFLLVVLAGSARHGRRLGVGLAILSFLCFNFFLLPPYYTLGIADPLDWVVLLTFLVTGFVAAHLLERARREAANAHQRAAEIDRLSVLGAETLNFARPEDAVQAIAHVLQSTLRVAACDVYAVEDGAAATHRIAHAGTRDPPPPGPSDALFPFVIERGAVAVEHVDGTTNVTTDRGAPLANTIASLQDARVLVVPLEVRGRTVGLLRLADIQPIRLDGAQARFAAVLSYYAALGIERIRLVAEEEHAEALRRTDRLKDAFLAAVSHDLRTPLTTIKGLAHELSHVDDRALVIEEEADRLNRLVADLLDLSSIAAGALPINAEINAAEDLVGAALQQIAGLHRDRRITVSLPRGDDIVVGSFDFRHALRILVNLLDNALKYSPAPEPVELRTCRDDGWLVFEVLDRGAGVPATETEQIFEPFFRSTPSSAHAAGTGLGLAIARQLAEAQGGRLVYQPREGGGSRFSLRLRAAEIPPLGDQSS